MPRAGCVPREPRLFEPLRFRPVGKLLLEFEPIGFRQPVNLFQNLSNRRFAHDCSSGVDGPA